MDSQESASENQWYWSKQGSDERNGPVSRERLEELAEEGDLEPEDLVWRKGFDDWKEAGSVEELKDLFVSPPSLPEESSQENVKEDAPPSLSENKGSKATEEYSFPVEFEVEWGGLVSRRESTLQLRRNEISLHTNDWVNHGGSIDHRYFEIKELDKTEVVSEAPYGFDSDFDNKKHYIEFNSIEAKDKFLKLIKRAKEERENLSEESEVGATGNKPSTLPEGKPDDESRATKSEAISCIHDYDENDVCQKCGWLKRELIVIGEESHREEGRKSFSEKSTDASSSTGSRDGQDTSSSDGRYWYNKKRWAIPFFWALVPAILWNGYEKYMSGKKDREWFKGYVPLFLQLAWFPPIGWYGLYKNDKLTGGKSLTAVLISPVLFILVMLTLYYPIALKNVSEFENSRGKILKSLSKSDSPQKAIGRAEKYAFALNFLNKKDRRLSSILDSLREEKRESYVDKKINEIKKESSFKKSFEAAKEYRKNGKYVNERFLSMLDSLRIKKAKGVFNKMKWMSMKNVSKKLELTEKALKMAKSATSSPKELISRIESKSKKLTRYAEEGKCVNISGRYSGRCRVFLNELKILPGVLTIRDKCKYDLEVTTGIPLEGKIKYKDKKNTYDMSGRALRINGGEATVQYEVGRYTANCKLYK